jgi:hypothetical protein
VQHSVSLSRHAADGRGPGPASRVTCGADARW